MYYYHLHSVWAVRCSGYRMLVFMWEIQVQIWLKLCQRQYEEKEADHF